MKMSSDPKSGVPAALHVMKTSSDPLSGVPAALNVKMPSDPRSLFQ